MMEFLKKDNFGIRRRLGRAVKKTIDPDFKFLEEAILGWLSGETSHARAAHLQWAFTRAESPYVLAIIKAGGLLKAAETVYGTSLDEPLRPEHSRYFSVPEDPNPTLGAAIRSIVPILSLMRIAPPKGFWVEARHKPSEFNAENQ